MMTPDSRRAISPLVSIVVPAFNAGRYIEETIQSVISQTYSNWELIIVDDCSTDHTAAIVRQYCETDPRIRLITAQTNSGVANARNLGMSAAQGEWVALLDSDDIWMEQKLEKQLALASQTNADLVYCSYLLWGEKEKAFLVPDRIDFDTMLYKSVISCSTVMMSKEIAERYRFDNRFYHEDLVLWLTILQDGRKAYGCREVLAKYRLTAGSRSFNKLHSAWHRWKIYRTYLHLTLSQSFTVFVRYALGGIKKYR